MHHPERVTALISQSGNAYEEGLNRAALRAFLKPEAPQGQYTYGVANPERLSPDAWYS